MVTSQGASSSLEFLSRLHFNFLLRFCVFFNPSFLTQPTSIDQRQSMTTMDLSPCTRVISASAGYREPPPSHRLSDRDEIHLSGDWFCRFTPPLSQRSRHNTHTQREREGLRGDGYSGGAQFIRSETNDPVSTADHTTCASQRGDKRTECEPLRKKKNKIK